MESFLIIIFLVISTLFSPMVNTYAQFPLNDTDKILHSFEIDSLRDELSVRPLDQVLQRIDTDCQSLLVSLKQQLANSGAFGGPISDARIASLNKACEDTKTNARIISEQLKADKSNQNVPSSGIISIPGRLASYTPYSVERRSGFSQLLLRDEFGVYLVQYLGTCSSLDFTPLYTGMYISTISPTVVLIDTSHTELLVKGFNDNIKSCNVTSWKELNLHKFYVESVDTLEDILIVKGTKNDYYKVSYGIGCLTIPTYENNEVDIDIGGIYLDAISDTIYLFDDNESCSVRESDNIPDPSLILPILTPVPIVTAPSSTPVAIPTLQALLPVGFSDVNEYTPYYNAIDFLRSKSIVGGFPDGTFKPDNTLTRAELLKIVLLSEYGNLQNRSDVCFSDVDPGTWYNRFACFAKEKNIISGYADGKFKPNQPVTYLEALKITMNVKGLTPANISNPWYKTYLDKSSEIKIALPDTDKDAPLIRAKMAELITRAIKYKDEGPNSGYLQ